MWQSAASALRAKLLKALGPEQCSELHIVGRSRKQKVMLDVEHVTERMEVAGKTYEYMQVRRLPVQGACTAVSVRSMKKTVNSACAAPADGALLCWCGRLQVVGTTAWALGMH